MSVYVKNRKPLKGGRVRTWYRCDDCGMYGDMSTTSEAVADDLLRRIVEHHRCEKRFAS